MGGFSRALEGLQGSHKIAAAIGDPALELQVYVSLSELYGRLQDAEKSARYASKAYDLSRSLQVKFVCEKSLHLFLYVELLVVLGFAAGRSEFFTPSSSAPTNGLFVAQAR